MLYDIICNSYLGSTMTDWTIELQVDTSTADRLMTVKMLIYWLSNPLALSLDNRKLSCHYAKTNGQYCESIHGET